MIPQEPIMIWTVCSCYQLLSLECSFNSSAHDCHTTPGLLIESEPGNEAWIDSLCETLIGSLLQVMCKLYTRQNLWGTQLCIPSIIIKEWSHEITTVTIYVLYI